MVEIVEVDEGGGNGADGPSLGGNEHQSLPFSYTHTPFLPSTFRALIPLVHNAPLPPQVFLDCLKWKRILMSIGRPVTLPYPSFLVRLTTSHLVLWV